MPDEQDRPNLNDLGPFADALKRLAPQPAHMSRDALLFEAGKASASPRLAGWAWPSTAAAFAGVSFVLAAFMMSPGSAHTQYVDRVVYVNNPVAEPAGDAHAVVHEPAAKPKPRSRDEDSEAARMFQVRRDVLRWGVEMLPESKSAGRGRSQDVAAGDLKRWLNLPPGILAVPAHQPTKPAKHDGDDE